jgi:hypothetical protein
MDDHPDNMVKVDVGKVMNPKIEPTGNCFESAANLFIDLAMETGLQDGVVLCHGICTGQGPIEGVEYTHAWILLEESGIVLDTERMSVHPAARYYQIGQIKQVTKYDFEDVKAMIVEHGHYGPWEEKYMALP